MVLTDAKLRSLKPQKGDFKLSDGGGLFLLVKPTGGKLWRLPYRFNKMQKTFALGVYPAVSLLDARQARDLAKRQLAKGLDPSRERKAEKRGRSVSAANTFKVVGE
jgi:hypothetical protein